MKSFIWGYLFYSEIISLTEMLQEQYKVLITQIYQQCVFYPICFIILPFFPPSLLFPSFLSSINLPFYFSNLSSIYLSMYYSESFESNLETSCPFSLCFLKTSTISYIATVKYSLTFYYKLWNQTINLDAILYLTRVHLQISSIIPIMYFIALFPLFWIQPRITYYI